MMVDFRLLAMLKKRVSNCLSDKLPYQLLHGEDHGHLDSLSFWKEHET